MTTTAGAMPPNPERLTHATSCREALQNIRLAAAGSPLVSAEENREILEKAIAEAERLCGEKRDGGGGN